jgi:hypothetical protein
VLAVNLSPRLSDLHLVDAISGHFPPYVQQALLSAGVRTVQDALTFLRKMETMESFDERGKQNSDTTHNARNTQCGSNGNGQGRFDRNRNNYHQVRNTNFRGNQGYNWKRLYSHHDGGQTGPFTARDNTGPGIQDRNSDGNHGGLNPRVNSYDPDRNDTHLTNQGYSSGNNSGKGTRTMQRTAHCPPAIA